jgi:hypothetical protein
MDKGVENAEIVEVKRISGSLLVTFSDGRMTALYSDEIYAQSVAVPESSIHAGSSDNNSSAKFRRQKGYLHGTHGPPR